jgi:hypothetical protein
MASATRSSIAFAFVLATSLVVLSIQGFAEEPAEAPLALETTIPLPDVSGRIDHMAVDLKRRRLIVAELGNNTADVVDLSTGKTTHRITGLSEPKGVGYSGRGDIVVIANAGDGSVRLFRGDDLTPAGTIKLGDPDNVRTDPRNGMVVVGFGNGGLALIDPVRRAKIAEIQLPAHPKGFQIDPLADRAYVNLPDFGEVDAVDLETRRVVAETRTLGVGGNFPMELDPALSLLAVVFRNPPVLTLLERDSGFVREEAATCDDADDVFLDEGRHRIYISCGVGRIAVFKVEDNGTRPLPSVETAPGARTSLFVPDLDRLFVARRAGLPGSGAAVLVYRPMG